MFNFDVLRPVANTPAAVQLALNNVPLVAIAIGTALRIAENERAGALLTSSRDKVDKAEAVLSAVRADAERLLAVKGELQRMLEAGPVEVLSIEAARKVTLEAAVDLSAWWTQFSMQLLAGVSEGGGLFARFTEAMTVFQSVTEAQSPTGTLAPEATPAPPSPPLPATPQDSQVLPMRRAAKGRRA